ncbi:hypothetical protein ACOSQ2_028919 [Xanthoceras sorbifolium]
MYQCPKTMTHFYQFQTYHIPFSFSLLSFSFSSSSFLSIFTFVFFQTSSLFSSLPPSLPLSLSLPYISLRLQSHSFCLCSSWFHWITSFEGNCL